MPENIVLGEKIGQYNVTTFDVDGDAKADELLFEVYAVKARDTQNPQVRSPLLTDTDFENKDYHTVVTQVFRNQNGEITGTREIDAVGRVPKQMSVAKGLNASALCAVVGSLPADMPIERPEWEMMYDGVTDNLQYSAYINKDGQIEFVSINGRTLPGESAEKLISYINERGLEHPEAGSVVHDVDVDADGQQDWIWVHANFNPNTEDYLPHVNYNNHATNISSQNKKHKE